MMASTYPETVALHEIISIAGGGHFRRDGQAIQAPGDAHEQTLMNRIKAGDFDTSQQLIASNVLHVLRCHRSYAHSGTGIFDLLQAGNLGLVHALETFEPEGNGRFSTYAAMCIRQQVERALKTPPA